MKHAEIYDKHQDRRSFSNNKKKRTNENFDRIARKARVSFKNYVRDIRNSELEEDFDDGELDVNYPVK